MSTGKIIGIVGGVAAIVVVVLVIGSIASTFSATTTQNNAYCDSWSLQIEERRSELSGEWIQTDSEWATFNQQIDDYNQQCAS